MWPNPQETADIVTLIEEILNGKLHFMNSEICKLVSQQLYYDQTPRQVFSWGDCDNFRNIYFKGHLQTTISELYWFKVKEIVQKTEMYPETIIGDIFRIQCRSKLKLFAKIVACIYPLTIFAKHFILLISHGCEYALIKLNRTEISATLFSSNFLSLHYYFAMRH